MSVVWMVVLTSPCASCAGVTGQVVLHRTVNTAQDSAPARFVQLEVGVILEDSIL